MSTRLISPIILESKSIRINDFDSLIHCADENDQVYSLIFHSGDAQRLAHAYGKIAPFPAEQLDIGLETSADPFSQQGQIHLFGSIYNSFAETSQNELFIVGYFRQKTAILLEGHLTITNNTAVSFCTIKGGSITIGHGVVLQLVGCLIDNCKIFVEDGGWLGIDDVTLSGSSTAAIFIHRGGTIGQFRKVSFLDVHKKFHIECATTETVGALLDLSNADKIIEFLEDSIIEEFELVSDFVPVVHQDFELRQPIKITNMHSAAINIRAGTIFASSSLTISSNTSVFMNIVANEIDDIFLSLGNFQGSITIDDVGSATLHNTLLSKSLIALSETNMEISLCGIDGNDAITAENTSLKIYDTAFSKSKNTIKFIRGQKTEDFKSNIENTVDFYNVSAKSCSNFLSGSIKQALIVKSKEFVACSNVFNLSSCAIVVSSVAASDAELFFNLSGCILDGEDVVLNGGNIQVSGKSSEMKFKNSSFTAPSKYSFTAISSIIELRSSNVNGGENNVHLMESSELRHLNTTFGGTSGGSVSGDYGRKIIDLGEEAR